MTQINGTTNIKCWRMGVRYPNSLRRDPKLVQPLWKSAWRILKKLKAKPPDKPAVAFLGLHPKDVAPHLLSHIHCCSPHKTWETGTN